MSYEKNIEEFETDLKRAEKLLFLSNFFKSKKLILATLEEISSANKNLMIAILKFNHIKGNIKLSQNPKENKKILHEEIAINWDIEELLNKSQELSLLAKKHKESPIEFMKKGKVVILDDDQNIETITIFKLKQHLSNIKQIKEALKFRIQE
jgi:hypothetical protein